MTDRIELKIGYSYETKLGNRYDVLYAVDTDRLLLRSHKEDTKTTIGRHARNGFIKELGKTSELDKDNTIIINFETSDLVAKARHTLLNNALPETVGYAFTDGEFYNSKLTLNTSIKVKKGYSYLTIDGSIMDIDKNNCTGSIRGSKDRWQYFPDGSIQGHTSNGAPVDQTQTLIKEIGKIKLDIEVKVGYSYETKAGLKYDIIYDDKEPTANLRGVCIQTGGRDWFSKDGGYYGGNALVKELGKTSKLGEDKPDTGFGEESLSPIIRSISKGTLITETGSHVPSQSLMSIPPGRWSFNASCNNKLNNKLLVTLL